MGKIGKKEHEGSKKLLAAYVLGNYSLVDEYAGSNLRYITHV